MMVFDFWLFIAFQMLAIGSGVVTAGLIFILGGLGGLSTLARRQVITEQRVEDVDMRITSEVKKRAGQIAQKALAKGRSAQAEVDEVLAQENADLPLHALANVRKKPSVVNPASRPV